MNGDKVVLDTNVLIYMSKGLIDEQKLLELNFNEFYVSVITFMELYGYKFKNPNEKERIDRFFNYIEVVHTNTIIADKVIEYRVSTPKKIKLPDAIILATTSYLKATLLTDDWDDFQNIDNAIAISNLDDLKVG